MTNTAPQLSPPKPPMRASLNDNRLISVDMWRGIAALAVVAIHVPHYAHGGWREHPFFFFAFLADYGYLGVPLFVVISGFCIHRRAASKKAETGQYQLKWTQFWKRRFWRLYPAYLAAIAFSLGCAFWLHDRSPELRTNWVPDLIWHLLLAHNLTDSYSTSLGNGAFWSLGMEEQLYGLYFLLFLLFHRVAPGRAILVVALLSFVWRLAVPLLGQDTLSIGLTELGSWYQWPFSYWLHWALGALAVDAYFGNTKLPSWSKSGRVALVLVCVGLMLNKNAFGLVSGSNLGQQLLGGVPSEATLRMFSAVHLVGELVWAVAFFCLINWGLDREGGGRFRGVVPRALAYVGRCSYSLYLVHVPVIYILETQFPFGYSPRDWVLRYLLYVPIILAVGLGFYYAVERWFLVTPRFLLGSKHGQKAASPAAASATEPPSQIEVV